MAPDKSLDDTSQVLENLIISVIAVNNCSLSEAYGLRDALAMEGLTKCSIFGNKIPDAFTIKTFIIKGGYKRGDYVALLLGERIKRILETAKIRGFEEFLGLLSTDEETATKELKQLYGVGPAVIKNFLGLQYSQK